MPIEFQCVSCRKTLRVGDNAAGKKARCPECGTIQSVPLSSTVIAAPVDPQRDTGAHHASHPDEQFSSVRDPSHFPPDGAASASNPFGDAPFAAARPELADQNPYVSPLSSMPSIQPPVTDAMARLVAKQKVSGPALAMIAVSSLTLAVYLVVCIAAVAGNQRVDGLIVLGQFLLPLAVNGAVILGAKAMLSLRRYNLALVAAILLIIPCGGCCMLTFPIGIWALVVLNDPTVKNAFDKAEPPGTALDTSPFGGPAPSHFATPNPRSPIA